MKNATTYEPKIKKLLAGAKARQPEPPAEDVCVLAVLLEGILQADAQDAQAAEALAWLREEFVDLNELRVAQPKEIVEILGKDYPLARRKAESIRALLQGLFDRASAVEAAYMAQMPKRELRRHLSELGLDRYAAAYGVLKAFGGHAVCVDDTLAGCLEMDGYIEPGTTGDEAQGFLERVIPQKQTHAAHEALRGFAARRGKALAKKLRAEAEAARQVAEKARLEAEAAAEAARKAAEEEAKKQAAKQAAEKKKADEKKKAARKAARKAAKAAAKKPAAKPAAEKAAPKAGARNAARKAPAKRATRKK